MGVYFIYILYLPWLLIYSHMIFTRFVALFTDHEYICYFNKIIFTWVRNLICILLCLHRLLILLHNMFTWVVTLVTNHIYMNRYLIKYGLLLSFTDCVYMGCFLFTIHMLRALLASLIQIYY